MADIAGDLDVESRFAEDGPEERSRRRLPIRSRHADHPVREEPRTKLDLRDDLDAPSACGSDRSGRARDARALDDEPDAVELPVVPVSEHDVCSKTGDADRGIRVVRDDVDTGVPQRRGGRPSRPREPDDESAVGERRHAAIVGVLRRAQARCAMITPQTIAAAPTAIVGVTLSPSTTTASAKPDSGWRNCNVEIRAMPPRSRAQYQPM